MHRITGNLIKDFHRIFLVSRSKLILPTLISLMLIRMIYVSQGVPKRDFLNTAVAPELTEIRDLNILGSALGGAFLFDVGF